VWESEMSRRFICVRSCEVQMPLCESQFFAADAFFLAMGRCSVWQNFLTFERTFHQKLCKFLPYCTTSHMKEKVSFLCIDTSTRDPFLSSSSAVFCSNVLDHYVSRNFSVSSLKIFWNMGRAEAWLVGWLVHLIYFFFWS